MGGLRGVGLLASLGLIASVCCAAVHAQSLDDSSDSDLDVVRDGPVNPLEGVALTVSWDGTQGEGKDRSQQ